MLQGGSHLGRLPMVVCLKHVGITDSVRESLKMSVKTLASWSTYALSTRPGNPFGPVALNVDLFKGSFSHPLSTEFQKSWLEDSRISCLFSPYSGNLPAVSLVNYARGMSNIT